MLVIGGNEQMKKAIRDAVAEVNQDAERAIDLKRKIATLEVEHGKKQEDWARREREVEHKVGLERKRQEFEIEQAKRETTTTVREENLKADKERFKSEMDFQRAWLEEEVTSLRTLVQKMLERLPSAEIYADLSGKGKK